MMFETLLTRMSAKAERGAREQAEALAERLQPEIEAEAVPGGVRLIGRGLRRRLVLEPALRWMRLL